MHPDCDHIKARVLFWFFTECRGIIHTSSGCDIYSSFAELRMKWIRFAVILSAAKDLYTVFTNSAEQECSFRVSETPQVSVKSEIL